MRALVDADRIRRFMRALGEAADGPTQVYFAGGATAVLIGWRQSTIDVDIRMQPDRDVILRAITRLKEELQMNVELASPVDFIPVKPGWEDRSPFVATEGPITFRHFDLYAQALAKVSRGHAQDLADVGEMITRGLVEPLAAREYFTAIEPRLYRYPALDAATFRAAVERALPT
jgi:Nucleotidyltransferase of unknown function (DUF6036)